MSSSFPSGTELCSSTEQSSRMTSPPIRIRHPLPPQPNPYIVPLISGIGFAAGAASYGLIRKLFDPHSPESVVVQHNISKPR